MVYIREAHPTDGWVAPANVRQGIAIQDPTTFQERREVAERACSVLHIKIPCLVDDMKDSVNQAYAAWPDRIYVVGLDGRIAVAAARGPAGFAPGVAAADKWLEKLAAVRAAAKRSK